MKIKSLVYILLSLAMTSCLPAITSTSPPTIAVPVMIQVEENPYRPRTSDARLKLAGAIINSTNLIERFDLDPFRVELIISGSVPSVCNELRINVAPPNEEYQIYVEVYSLVNTDINCDNVFQQFEASLLLGVYSNGRYTVWVNNGYAGDFITY